MIKKIGENIMIDVMARFFKDFDNEIKKNNKIINLERELAKDLKAMPDEISSHIENDIFFLLDEYKELAYTMGISQGMKLQKVIYSNDTEE